MSEVILTGLASNLDGEDRALAHLKVVHNGSEYEWAVFVPRGVQDIANFLESVRQQVLDEIDAKEAEWTSLEPKVRTVEDPAGGSIEVPIDKSEVVRPSIPDYYAKRRAEYPSLGDQLDAIWKGADSQAFSDMIAKISAVKAKYPKP